MQTATVVGTGRMGSALAKALSNSGFRTTVWNRTRTRAEPLADLGIRVATSLQEAVSLSEVILINVSDYATTLQLLEEPSVAAAVRGKVLVQVTTGTPDDARHLESWASQHGAGYLDGAIMSYPSGVGTPECTIFYSGPKTLFERVKPALLALGGNSLHVGEAIGHASAFDMASLSFVLGSMFGFVGGYVVCEKEGIAAETYMNSVKDLLPVTADILAGLSTSLEKKQYAGDEATIDVWSACPRELIAWYKARGFRHDVASAQLSLFDEAIKSGHSDADFGYVYEIMTKGAGKGTSAA